MTGGGGVHSPSSNFTVQLARKLKGNWNRLYYPIRELHVTNNMESLDLSFSLLFCDAVLRVLLLLEKLGVSILALVQGHRHSKWIHRIPASQRFDRIFSGGTTSPPRCPTSIYFLCFCFSMLFFLMSPGFYFG